MLQRIAGNWKTAERKVYTNGMLNVADALKLQSNELTLDMGNGTQTNINIGLTPKNYSGSGFTYTFYNGKNSLADIVAKTQAVTDNSNNVATTAFVQSTVANKVSKLVNSAPETLDTLNELANALGNDPNFATTVSTQIGQKANKTDVDSQIKNVTTKLAAHNSDKNAHDDIRQMFNSYLSFGSTNSSYNETGYRVFSDGFCIQWGKVVVSGENKTRVTLPIAYTSVCSPTLTVCTSTSNPNGANVISAYAGEINTTGFTALVDVPTNIDVENNLRFYG